MSEVREFIADREGERMHITQFNLDKYKNSTANNKNSIIVIDDYGIVYNGVLISI